MIKPIPGQNFPKNAYSHKKIWFQCDCGNKKLISWRNYNTNHTKSCGECLQRLKYNIESVKNKVFGHLKLDLNQKFPNKINSNTKLWWECDCGHKKKVVFKSVVNGLTKSCGKCNLAKPKNKEYKKPIYKSKEYWLNQDLPLELIDEDLPDEWCKGSTTKMKFRCKCGNIFTEKFGRIFSGHRKTCGECNLVKKEEFLNKKFGKLRLIDESLPNKIHGRTCDLFLFQCDCGNKKKIRFQDVIAGLTKSCGECNLRSKEWWESQTFGHLFVIKGKNITLHSEQKLLCKCTCGNVCYKQACALTIDKTKTCGECYTRGLKWFENLKPLIPTDGPIRYPLEYLRKYMKDSFLEPLEGAKNQATYVKFKCKLCGSTFKTKLCWIYHNHIVSCGCASAQVSFASNEIARFIKNLGFDVQYGKNEFNIGGLKYDIFIKEKKILIEHHGLVFHSDRFGDNSSNDIKKYQLALKNGYKYYAIFEDEWKYKRRIFENLIKNLLNVNEYKLKIRPQKCSIKLVKYREIKDLYNQYHYIGGEHLSAKYHIGVFYSGDLIAGLSIGKPSRQNSGDWEIARMVCNSDYHVHGLWSYLIKWVCRNLSIAGKLVTFSDNRLASGDVYKKMGFKKEHQIRPDYFWVKGAKRYHKSGLRKTKEEKLIGKTEAELRREQGYHQIRDCGKTKWALILPS